MVAKIISMNLEKLDNVFSIFIRMRDADDNGNVKCVTCPEISHWKAMDCGHFIPRGKLATRYSEINSHQQCPACNRLKDGNLHKYEIFMRATYGIKAIEQLKIKSHETVKWMSHEIQEMIEVFKSKIKKS